jgi:membrane protease YdiL (CAAX protease family)
MSSTAAPAGVSRPPFWRVVWVLLDASRRRAIGRQRRQAELLRQRSAGRVGNWGAAGFVIVALLMTLLNIAAACNMRNAVAAAERAEAERLGWTVVDDRFADKVAAVERQAAEKGWDQRGIDHALAGAYRGESNYIAQFYGGDRHAIWLELHRAVHSPGRAQLRSVSDAAPGLRGLPRAGSLPAMAGALVLLLWSVMLVFQGEGLELDTQRRRHPMWEFLFSHPVPQGAVFLAEMLSPMAANPIYYSAPLVAGILYGITYGPWLGALATVLVGLPVTAAAACLGKALEIAVILRFSSRSRGAIMGLMSWLGYACLMLLFISSFAIGSIVTALDGPLQPLAALPWPWLGLLLGQWGGGFSYAAGVLTCWLAAAAVAALAVRFSVWGAEQGLAGRAENAVALPNARRTGNAGFGKHPLFRKEFLWLMRDRSALVQAFLVPLTMASYQLFNMRVFLAHAQTQWNVLCGAGVLFGIYFLSVLGPKSLASEGPALWVSLTWPHGLESLLRAKAWLWTLISTALVAAVLIFAACLFPAASWKIALVGAGWYLFARSMAEKSVTLATVTSESGEAPKTSYGKRGGAQLGTFTFSIGVLTQQWSTAVMGIVYSMMTSAAMWQNFRAHLPFFYDPWSERLPQPPTLMHAMIAVSALVECGTIFAAIPMVFAGPDIVALVHALSYGAWAVIISLIVSRFLARRGVRQSDIWYWPKAAPAPSGRRVFVATLLAGAAGGVALGLLALGYLAALRLVPQAAELLDQARAQLGAVPHARQGLFIMGVLVAPVAEEFLFRGLLYRALDREWGGWRAIAGSAAFFAIYHPPLSWLPVAALGACNAMLFKRTGRLAPAVALHMAYNSVILGA